MPIKAHNIQAGKNVPKTLNDGQCMRFVVSGSVPAADDLLTTAVRESPPVDAGMADMHAGIANDVGVWPGADPDPCQGTVSAPSLRSDGPGRSRARERTRRHAARGAGRRLEAGARNPGTRRRDRRDRTIATSEQGDLRNPRPRRL